MFDRSINHLLPSNDAKEMPGLWTEPFEAFKRLVPTFRLDA